MQVLSVRNGNGQDVKDAKFVEILRSAGSRIKSAHDSFKGIGNTELEFLNAFKLLSKSYLQPT